MAAFSTVLKYDVVRLHLLCSVLTLMVETIHACAVLSLDLRTLGLLNKRRWVAFLIACKESVWAGLVVRKVSSEVGNPSLHCEQLYINADASCCVCVVLYSLVCSICVEATRSTFAHAKRTKHSPKIGEVNR